MNLGMIIVNACSLGLCTEILSGSGAEGLQNGHGYIVVAAIYGIIAIPLF